MSKTYSKTRTLVECALMIAVGTVLAQIKLFTMPQGGSVTLLSMLPFILVSFRHGTKWGLLTGFVNSLLQMMMGFWAPPGGYHHRADRLHFAGLCAGFLAAGHRLPVGKALQKSAGRHCCGNCGCVCNSVFVQLYLRLLAVGQLSGGI